MNATMKPVTKKILFFIPPTHVGIDAIAKNLAFYKEIPYGVLSIAAYVKKNSVNFVDFKIVDLNLYSEDVKTLVSRELATFKPDIVGISGLFTSMFNQVRDISKIIKEKATNVFLVVGGNVSTNCAPELFKYNPYIDAACHSEGEIPMLDLIESQKPELLIAQHQSWITRDKIQKGFTAQATYVEDLDEIPPLDFSLLDLPLYDNRCRNNNPMLYSDIDGARLPFITTRGCPFKCVFCAAGSLSGKKVRSMSEARVIADMREAKVKYKMAKIVINDDQALLYKQRMKNILAEIADLGLVLEFPSGLNVKFIDEDMAKGFKKAGLDIANLAIESGSERVLREIINKPLKIKDVKPAVDLLRNQGLLVHGFFIFGFLGETSEDREATVKLIKEIGLDWSNIYVAAPIRGSRLYEICVENGYITDDSDLLTSNIYESNIRTSQLDPEEITKFVYKVNLDVNFVNNYSMANENYNTAIGYFSNVANNHPGHAFAHYFLAKAYKLSGKPVSLYRKHEEQFAYIVNNDAQWAEQAKEFGIL